MSKTLQDHRQSIVRGDFTVGYSTITIA